MSTNQRVRTPLLIVFLDLTRFMAQSQRGDDDDLATTLDGFYQRVTTAVRRSEGRVVKFIGDAALIVYPEVRIDAGVTMLLELKPAIDRYLSERGWESRMNAKVHFGEVVAGPFGDADEQRFDVIGRAVNIAAVLESHGVTLSSDAFRKLSPALRQQFRKHTPPVTYIRLDDPRPARPGRART